MNASLVLVGSGQKLREITLTKPVHVIGRQQDCQIRIPVDAVSRHHAELRVAGNKIAIKDLGSSNGTFVNKRRVSETELGPGDTVAIGPALFVVRVDGQPSSIDSEAARAKGALPTPEGGVADLDDSSLVDFDFSDDEDAPPKL